MSELFEIKNKKDFIVVSCYRFENFNDVKTLVKEISNVCRQYNSFKILIQNYSRQHLSSIHCVLIVEYLKDAGITQHHKIALVKPLKTQMDDKNEFLITVAMNRGWYNIKFFNELSKAKMWLDS